MMTVQVGSGSTLVINGETHECVGPMEFHVRRPEDLPKEYRSGWIPGSEVTLTLQMNEDIAKDLIQELRSGRTVAIEEGA